MKFKDLFVSLVLPSIFIISVYQWSKAQDIGFSQALDPSMLQLKSMASLASAPSVGRSMQMGTYIDNSIDSDGYSVGGGDVFSVHIVELPSLEYTAIVDQNCDVTIPDLGRIKLGRKSLAEAKTAIGAFVKSKLKKQYEIYVSLTKTKTAVITVTGDVSNPGTYQVDGTTRLLDAIRLANNAPVQPNVIYNLREVACANKGVVRLYDLYKFLMVNDLTQNPYVYPGDNIMLKISTRSVYVSGAIKSSNSMVPIKPGEAVRDFLALVSFDASADSENIMVSKSDAGGRTAPIIFSLKNPGALTLSDRDMVVVPQKSNYPRIDTVKVSGEVARPGVYPIVWKKTTARSLIEQAGSATQYGAMDRAFIIRRSKLEISENTFGAAARLSSSPVSPVVTVRPEKTSALSQMTTSSDYAVFALETDGRETMLDPGDELVVPKIETLVYVSGSVRMPGAYPFSSGKDRDYYIQKAGGYTHKADRGNAFVMMRYADVSQIKENSNVQEGDIIVVPESTQYKFVSTIILPIVAIVLSAIGTTVSTYSIFHKN